MASGSPWNGNTETDGPGFYLQRAGGLSSLPVPLQRLGRPCRTASHRLSGVGGAFRARWGLRAPCRGQEECSSEQQVEVASGKGSSPGIIGLRSEERLGHMAR